MLHFLLQSEQHFDPSQRVEKILGRVDSGDASVACWEPHQVSPYHCHPRATEIYFCFQGGGRMRTRAEQADVAPGGFVVHPPGELHEFTNGPARTLLFRVRYGQDMASHTADWRQQPGWTPKPEDLAYFRRAGVAELALPPPAEEP